MNLEPIINIYQINLKVKSYEKVLIFTDTIREDENLTVEERHRRHSLVAIARTIREIGKDLCKEILYAEYPSLGSPGIEPPEAIWKIAFGDKTIKNLKKTKLFHKLLSKNISSQEILLIKEIVKQHCNEAVNVVIALSNFSTSHTNFRDILTKFCGTRYASMPLFDLSMLDGSMTADWKTVKHRALKVKQILDRGIKIKIKTPNGTEIEILRGKRKIYIDSGILTRRGSFGNLPAGEVFFAPLEGSAKGKLVIEWAPTRKLKSPLILKVEKGEVISIEGNEPYKKELEAILNKRQENRNIAELGIGMNDKAIRPDNILESEKILGIIHIALGDNSSFGGRVRTPMHQDFIFFNPDLYAVTEEGEKIKILQTGQLMVS